MLKPFMIGVPVFLSFAFGAGRLSAATHRVGPCSGSQYGTIGAAITAAQPGDMIEICPGLYPEQLVVSKPLTLRGITANGYNRVLIQPTLAPVSGLSTQAVITVLNTNGVTLQNLAIDASHNSISGCGSDVPALAGVHFSSSSGILENSAIFGAQVMDPASCAGALPFGNGFGVQVDAAQAGSYQLWIGNNSIHDYTSNGIQVNGTGIGVEIAGNSISGVGPALGTFQFAVFILNGATANIHQNIITEGLCGALSPSDCINVRSEGVTLRAIGDGTIVDSNVITNAQSGIFINGANRLRVSNNQIRNIDAMSGMDIQASASGVFTNSVILNNGIFNVGPIDMNASNNEEGCGIDEYSGTGTFSGNQLWENAVTDAYCGVAHVGADVVQLGAYFDVLYNELNSDDYPSAFPPAVEP